MDITIAPIICPTTNKKTAKKGLSQAGVSLFASLTSENMRFSCIKTPGRGAQSTSCRWRNFIDDSGRQCLPVISSLYTLRENRNNRHRGLWFLYDPRQAVGVSCHIPHRHYHSMQRLFRGSHIFWLSRSRGSSQY